MTGSMPRLAGVAAALVVAIVLCVAMAIPVRQDALLGAQTAEAGPLGRPAADPCTPPSGASENAAQTAWQLWVAAACPVNNDFYPYVVWENWIEQAQMYPTNPADGLKVPNAQAAATSGAHLLHASPLTLVEHPGLGAIVPGLLGGADQNCNKAATPPASEPDLVLCEEVRLNGAQEDYTAGTELWNRAGQAQAAAKGAHIAFSAPSVEIKADWVQLSSIGFGEDGCGLPLGFDASIHVERINGHCFALAGMHLISKLKNKWIWATFEPQNTITNPNRCQVLGCVDRFGAQPATTHGASTQLTSQLTAMMTAARLSREWFNYRLDGVQTDYFRPELLGNSVIEGENAGVPLNQSSCITCHAASAVKSDGTDGITLLSSNPVGQPAPLPSSAWIRRDFVWSLSLACPNSPFQTCGD